MSSCAALWIDTWIPSVQPNQSFGVFQMPGPFGSGSFAPPLGADPIQVTDLARLSATLRQTPIPNPISMDFSVSDRGGSGR